MMCKTDIFEMHIYQIKIIKNKKYGLIKWCILEKFTVSKVEILSEPQRKF